MKKRNIVYPFSHSIMFALVMQDVEICKGLLERILPNEKFSKVQLLDEIIENGTEKTIVLDPTRKGVRMDAYAVSCNNWYNIEMQTYSDTDLPKRARYNSSALDIERLRRGEPYKALGKKYVIFICTFDLFGKNKPMYIFENYDVKNSLNLEDESYIIILNTKCTKEVPENLEILFRYINSGELPDGNDGLLEQIDHAVEEYNSGDWRVKIMTLEQEILNREYAAREEGFAEGLEQGLEQGREKGLAEGREEGRQEATKKLSITAQNLVELGMDEQTIAKVIDVGISELRKYLK